MRWYGFPMEVTNGAQWQPANNVSISEERLDRNCCIGSDQIRSVTTRLLTNQITLAAYSLCHPPSPHTPICLREPLLGWVEEVIWWMTNLCLWQNITGPWSLASERFIRQRSVQFGLVERSWCPHDLIAIVSVVRSRIRSALESSRLLFYLSLTTRE